MKSHSLNTLKCLIDSSVKDTSGYGFVVARELLCFARNSLASLCLISKCTAYGERQLSWKYCLLLCLISYCLGYVNCYQGHGKKGSVKIITMSLDAGFM